MGLDAESDNMTAIKNICSYPRQAPCSDADNYNCRMKSTSRRLHDATLGDRVETLRLEKQWTQQFLADEVNRLGGKTSQGAINRLEKESYTKSSISSFLAQALGVNHDWLLTGKGTKAYLKSIDHKMQLLPQDDFDDLYDDFTTLIERRLEKRNIRQ
jgi:transcriptional regulator with XRE-family HTH domain